jgi:hypothetical protein
MEESVELMHLEPAPFEDRWQRAPFRSDPWSPEWASGCITEAVGSSSHQPPRTFPITWNDSTERSNSSLSLATISSGPSYPFLSTSIATSHPVSDVESRTSSIRAPISSTSSEVCEDCGKEYKGEYGRGNLARHQRQKHGLEEKSYPCKEPGCLKDFKRPDALLLHHRRKHRHLAPKGQSHILTHNKA